MPVRKPETSETATKLWEKNEVISLSHHPPHSSLKDPRSYKLFSLLCDSGTRQGQERDGGERVLQEVALDWEGIAWLWGQQRKSSMLGTVYTSHCHL